MNRNRASIESSGFLIVHCTGLKKLFFKFLFTSINATVETDILSSRTLSNDKNIIACSKKGGSELQENIKYRTQWSRLNFFSSFLT